MTHQGRARDAQTRYPIFDYARRVAPSTSVSTYFLTSSFIRTYFLANLHSARAELSDSVVIAHSPVLSTPYIDHGSECVK